MTPPTSPPKIDVQDIADRLAKGVPYLSEQSRFVNTRLGRVAT